MCPEGEIKRIKKDKVATMKAFQAPRLRKSWKMGASSAALPPYCDGRFIVPLA
jgi:hypothetical protein